MFNIFAPKKINFPSKVELQSYNGIKFMKRIPVKDNLGKVVYLHTLPNGENCNAETLVTTKRFSILSTHEYDILKPLKVLNGYNIEVIPKKQKQGIGEIMRLASIIEMKENGLDQIRLKSLPKALLFHLKYKFHPQFLSDDSNTAKKILTELLSSNFSSQKMHGNIEKMLLCIEKNGIKSENHNLSQEIANLVLDYIKINSNNWDNAKFHTQIPLVLKNEDLKKYASFYNKLFKKHEIDYKI